MSGTSDPIRIDDLAQPVLSDAQRAAIAWADRQQFDFSEAAVLREAREQTGLDDFGADDFLSRLRVWLRAVEEDTDLNGIGRMGVHAHVVRILCNRLRVEDLLKRHPEILGLEIRRPIIVVGLPRSGTTHLLNLIGADTRLRSIPYWESMEPVPVPGEGPAHDGLDPRFKRCQAAYEAMIAGSPLLKAMHDMPPEHIHEEIELLELDFASYNVEWLALVPRWRDHYLSLDLTPSYAYLKRALKVLQYFRPGERWVLKCPQHLEQLGPLLRAFPDATLAITHRDPVSVIQSAITMVGYGDRMRRRRVDLAAVADYWIDRIERLLRACVRDRDLVPEGRGLDVLFHEFMADDIGMVERIYQLAGLPMTPEARAELAAHLERNRRGRHGRLVYDLKGDFGIDPDQLRRRFEFYFERFAVRPER